MEADRREFYQASMKYVLKLQEMHEKKKFEFVENLLGYMSGWMTFYHEGYEKLGDFRLNDKRLRLLLQKARENFECTKGEAEQLMDKMLKAPGTELMDQSAVLQGFTRQGYLYLMEKKALGTSWTKYFCQYNKETKELFCMVYMKNGEMGEPDKYILQSCTRRKTESIDRRFCFDVIVKDRPNPLTFQALSGDDRRYWLDALDGREPVYLVTEIKSKSVSVSLNEDGFNFVKKAIAAVEARGLETEGLYRLPGVQSAVATLLEKALRRDHKKSEPNYEDPVAVDTRTLTSTLKLYFRSLSEPLMTFDLYDSFVAAAKQETEEQRLESVMLHIKKLPSANFNMLALLVGHLARIAEKSAVNGMSSANLGICFSPSLIRPRSETMASVLDLRFCSIFVEILIQNYEKIFRLRADAVNCGEAKYSAAHRPSFSVAPAREPDTSVTLRRKSSPAIKTPETESSGPVKSGRVSALAKHFNQTSKPNFTGSGSIKLRNLSDSIVPGATSSRSEKKSNNKKDTNEEFKKPELEEGTPGHEYELVDRVAGRLAKSKYACTGGSVSELSFEAHQIIHDGETLDDYCNTYSVSVYSSPSFYYLINNQKYDSLCQVGFDSTSTTVLTISGSGLDCSQCHISVWDANNYVSKSNGNICSMGYFKYTYFSDYLEAINLHVQGTACANAP
ncbi:hypothetical protein C0Q70_05450 [Pomacea canaliculata]|uniref:Rho-GAP domain-containing protein n=1 Tax=Pomacea canaliculata TaxID=400727 RepID=A0A2T7PL78_POMCA|nr:hypothetical protein C0Q70_05450 [Pomacea canaliculata]